jgi:segregation and condensation protein A
MAQEAVLKESKANEEIIEILLEKDELTWRNLLYELVREEDMDPWDINVGQLAQRFLDMIQTLQEMDFRITGKLVLAAALLLKIKSNHLLEEDLTALDDLIEGAENPVDLLDDLPGAYEMEEPEPETPNLVPRTPQPRQRSVSMHDLVGALEKALKVEMRRMQRRDDEQPEMHVEVDDIDISKVIRETYDKVHAYYEENDEQLMFDTLVPQEAEKHDRIFTFIPLLHLDHQRNVDLEQEETFGPIGITFLQELDDDFAVPEGDLGTT